MTGRDITAQAIAETREAVRERNRLAALPLSETIERARQRVYARAAAGAKPVVPLALQTALAADERRPYPPAPFPQPRAGAPEKGENGQRRINAPEEKTPERMRRRGKTSPMGVLMRGMLTGPKTVSRAQLMDPDYHREREEREGE